MPDLHPRTPRNYSRAATLFIVIQPEQAKKLSRCCENEYICVDGTRGASGHPLLGRLLSDRTASGLILREKDPRAGATRVLSGCAAIVPVLGPGWTLGRCAAGGTTRLPTHLGRLCVTYIPLLPRWWRGSGSACWRQSRTSPLKQCGRRFHAGPHGLPRVASDDYGCIAAAQQECGAAT